MAKIIDMEGISLICNRVKDKLQAIDAKSIKAVDIAGNVIKFYTSTEENAQAAVEINLPINTNLIENDISEVLAQNVNSLQGQIDAVSSSVIRANYELINVKSELKKVNDLDEDDEADPRFTQIRHSINNIAGELNNLAESIIQLQNHLQRIEIAIKKIGDPELLA